MTLTDLDKQILAIEAKTWRYEGAKEAAILNLGLRRIGYYQRINRLIDSPAALAHDPLTVNRLRRWRDQHRTEFLREIPC